jgi:integrase
MRKTIEPTRLHKDGGYEVKHVVKRRIDGKDKYFPVTKYVYFDQYPTKKACELAAKVKESECIEEALAKAEAAVTGQMAVTKKAETKIWTLKEVALDRIQKYGDASMAIHFQEVIRLAGDSLPEDFIDSYNTTIGSLRGTPIKGRVHRRYRSEPTINRYKSVFRMIFQHAIKVRALPPDHIVADYDFDFAYEDGRDRVWSEEEKIRIFQAMEELDSWLKYAVYFASINPIRASDLFGNAKDGNPGLRKSDYDSLKNWVAFLASKTGKSKRVKTDKKRPTFLKQIDDKLRNYFSSLPKSCDHLFPKIQNGFCIPIDKLNQGYRNEWKRICKKADVHGLRFHDLKHCAITYLLDHGYTERDLKQCGIQYSIAMINRYYHFSADKAPVIEGFEKPTLKLYQEAV